MISIHPTAEEALCEIPRRKPDIVLMDIKLPGMNGIQCLRHLKKLSPPLLCHILMLTEFEDSDLVFEAIKAGASGYLHKDRLSAREFSAAIGDVASGGAVMSPNIARKVMNYFHASRTTLGRLSERELEVLADLADGLMYKEIGPKRSIAENTVRTHVTSIYRKLHVRSRTDAVRHYLERPSC